MIRMSYYLKMSSLIFIKLFLLSSMSFGISTDPLPLLRYYLFRSGSYSVDYHQIAKKSCRLDYEIDTEILENQRRTKRDDQIRNWCEGDYVFFKFKKLKFSDCQWDNLATDSPIKNLGSTVDHLKKELNIRNLEIVLNNKVLTCQGELMIPGIKNPIKIQGLCAPYKAKMVQSQGINEFKSDPIVGIFNANEAGNELQKSIDKSLVIKNEKISLKMNIALPVPIKTVQDIDYLLSAQGQRKCQSFKKRESAPRN